MQDLDSKSPVGRMWLQLDLRTGSSAGLPRSYVGGEGTSLPPCGAGWGLSLPLGSEPADVKYSCWEQPWLGRVERQGPCLQLGSGFASSACATFLGMACSFQNLADSTDPLYLTSEL